MDLAPVANVGDINLAPSKLVESVHLVQPGPSVEPVQPVQPVQYPARPLGNAAHEQPVVNAAGGLVGAPIPPVEGFDPEAWHFDIHGNLISAPPAAYENMEVHQLPMIPVHQMTHPVAPHFYQHLPPPHMFRPACVPQFPIGRLPMMPYPRHQLQPDVPEMFHAQASIRPTYHKKSGGHSSNSPPLCHFFAQGRCRNGSQCLFSHEHGTQQQSGKHGHSNGHSAFQNGRADKFGHNRHFHHHHDRNHHANALPQSSRDCRYYILGNCRNGSNCRFAHDANCRLVPDDSASNTTYSALSTPVSISEPISPTPESQAAAQDASQAAAA